VVGAASDSTGVSISATSKRKKIPLTCGPHVAVRENAGPGCHRNRVGRGAKGPAALLAGTAHCTCARANRGKAWAPCVSRPGEIKAEEPERGEVAGPSGQKLRREKISTFFSFFQIMFKILFSCNKNQSSQRKICSGMYAQACV
jgi:hypothetical protein